MPIYEYKCSLCGHIIEMMQVITDDPIVGGSCNNKCPGTTERIMSAAGFRLKGTGWYVTDFKDKKKAT